MERGRRALAPGQRPPWSAEAGAASRGSDPRARVGVLFLVGLLLVGAASALVDVGSAPARAASCNQGGALISTNWTITTPQVCSGILYTVDGSVTVDAGGSLTLINGGLNFAKDASHTGYSLTVNAGGALALDHSTVTTETVAIDPYLKLALTVSGAGSAFTMTNDSLLRFPGWFNATGATITIRDSTIAGFSDAQLAGTGLYPGDNDNSAVITWASTAATLYHSQITQIYENRSAASALTPPTGIIQGNVSLTAGSVLTAYDSYIAVDYSNVTGLHNELKVDGTSAAYLYNVTIDRSEDPAVETGWLPAFVPQPGGRIDLLRWLQVSVTDATAFPVPGASIWSTFSPNATTAEYPDNGFSPIPNAATLAYLGRTASGANAWNRTDAGGLARIPLFTDEITAESLPNANSFGNFRYAVSYNTSTASGGVSFDPYPAVGAGNNTLAVAVSLPGLYLRTPPDLALRATDYPSQINVSENLRFSLNVTVHNLGETAATGVSVAAFLDGNRSAQLARVDGLAVDLFANATLVIPGIASVGRHTLMLAVDPNDTIYEGGAAQKANNFLNLTVNVVAPPGYLAIAAPNAGQTVEPGSTLSVSGYVRDPSYIGLAGVPVTVELRSGSRVIANASTVSGLAGFFFATIAVPANLSDGSYVIAVSSAQSNIQSDARAVTVQASKAFLNTNVPLLGVPWWLFLVLVAILAAAIVGVTVYVKVYGLGKMVECGECGAFIHADAAACPRCGVEFEKDLAKCSHCGAWIPVEVRQCPECGIAFATGELNPEDYEAKMRLQYEEVVEKFRAEAQRQLRRTLTDQEFQEWWRTQPTFVTFDEWRREEEEVRRKGSKPCPNCGTLNSLTAKVCHVCGTLMKGQVARKAGAAPKPGRQERAPEGPAGRSMISPSTGAEEEETPPGKDSQGPAESPPKNGRA